MEAWLTIPWLRGGVINSMRRFIPAARLPRLLMGAAARGEAARPCPLMLRSRASSSSGSRLPLLMLVLP